MTIAADIYRPEEWHDFFIMVGGAAAALTGLVFVALSLNLDAAIRDATHRHRSIGTIGNFAGIFMLCAFALMGGQGHVAIGIEWLVVSSGAGVIYVNGYRQARAGGGSPSTLSAVRTATGTALYVSLAVGAVLLAVGASAGLYIAAVAMILLGAYSITGAWLLLIGAHVDDSMA